MERLLSFSFCSESSISNRRLIPPGASPASSFSGSAASRSGLSLPRISGFDQAASLFSGCDGAHPPLLPPTSRPMSCLRNYVVPFSKEKGEQGFSSAQSAFARDLEGSFLHKVASIALSVLLLSATVTLIQTVLSRPVHATVQTATRTGGRFIGTEFLSSAWTGFFAGCLHTLSGPDHLAALAPLSIGRTRIESAVVGALWGCGHDAGQMIFGLIFLLLKDHLHIEIIRTWGTRVVGLTLLIIGTMGIKEASEAPSPCVEDGEGDVSMTHASGARRKIGIATFATGIVHGLQPDALVMILPALALPSRLAGAAFLGMFLVGTVFAMGTYTVFIGSCSQALKERVPRITEKLTWAASLMAISMGVAIIVCQFFGFSLY